VRREEEREVARDRDGARQPGGWTGAEQGSRVGLEEARARRWDGVGMSRSGQRTGETGAVQGLRAGGDEEGWVT